MAGYGNRTAPDYVAENLADQHDTTRFGAHTSVDAYSNAHPKHGSGTTGGAGFGNKTDLPNAPTSNDAFRFDLHKNTSAYSGADESRAGSGSTAGAGYGNKTGGFGRGGDSTLGKVMEKVGHMTHNEGLAAKGAAKRAERKSGEEGREEPPFAN